MVLHRHHHRAHHSVGYIGRSWDEQKIASRHPRYRHGVLASETTVAESPPFYTDCGNIKRFPRRSPLPDVDGWSQPPERMERIACIIDSCVPTHCAWFRKNVFQ